MKLLRYLKPRSGFRTFILVLCGFYLFLVFSFHSNLQGSGRQSRDTDVQRRRIRKAEDQQQMFDDLRKVENHGDEPSSRNKADHLAFRSKDPKDFPHREPLVRQAAAKVDDRSQGRADSQNNGEANNGGQFVPEKPQRLDTEACIGEEVDEFVFRPITNDVTLFSAYWDSRPNDFDNKDNGTFIRIMAISKRGQKPRLMCSFPTLAVRGAVVTSEISFYEMCENHGRPWGGYILSCRVPDTIESPMCSVTVQTQTQDPQPEEAPVTIRTIRPSGVPHNFATCVPPLFGNVGINQLTEFIEMTRALGSEHITFYDYNVGKSSRAVLDYFAEQGLVSIIPWTLPSHINNGMWYYGQLLAIQDCLYRNMHSAYYVSFNDIDEYIVPHGPELKDWADMVRQLAKPKGVGFSFISAFFDPFRTASKDSKYENFSALQTTQRTSGFSSIRTKCMVQPYRIFEKGIHHVSKPIFADLEVSKVQESVAFLHHYRKCVSNFGMDCSRFEEDKTLLKFADIVYRNVKKAANLLPES